VLFATDAWATLAQNLGVPVWWLLAGLVPLAALSARILLARAD
jgi:hypothetical protein